MKIDFKYQKLDVGHRYQLFLNDVPTGPPIITANRIKLYDENNSILITDDCESIRGHTIQYWSTIVHLELAYYGREK